ncbi:MAG: hypothetical protein R3D55_04870 [Chloroflexota bacterium]
MFCFDTSSPIFAPAWDAAYWVRKRPVSAAALIAASPEGNRVRPLPPGHHASAEQFGGLLSTSTTWPLPPTGWYSKASASHHFGY